MADYETILKSIPEEPDFLYKTSRGSTYGHYPDNTSVRNRSGQGHRDTTEGIQPRSGKTVYMRPADVEKMAGLFQNPELGTQFVPSSYDKETKTGKASLQFIEDYGPKKAGTVIHSAEFTTVPKAGLVPVEINKSESRSGESGRGIHWGTPIVEVFPRGQFPARMPAGTPSQMRPGAGGGSGPLLHMLNPLKMQKGGEAKMSNSTQDDFQAFVERIKQAESRGQRFDSKGKLLTSPKGAQGEMQVMPATQRDPGFGVAPVKNNSPDEIARVGRDLLRAFDAKYDGNKMYVAAAYNWGPGNVDKWIAGGADFNKLPKETQNYLMKVAPEALAQSRSRQAPATATVAPVEPTMDIPLGISASASPRAVAIGDSLAEGFAKANNLGGTYRSGAGPQAVMKMLQDYAANNSLQGMTVYLGTGLPNNPAQRDAVSQQIAFIKAQGGTPVVFGAGPGSQKNPTTGQNEFLQSAAQQAGAMFTGPLAERFPSIAKQDPMGLHLTASQYKELYKQVGGAPVTTTAAAAPSAPARSATTAAAVPAASAEDLGSGYKAALALAFLGEEDKEREATDDELRTRLNRQEDEAFAQELADYKPVNPLQDLKITALNPIKALQPVEPVEPVEPVRMAAGGVPFNPVARITPSARAQLESIKADYDRYNAAVPAYNAAVQKYETEVYQPYSTAVDKYNAAVEAYNAGPREADFTGVAPTAPAEFSMAAPVAPSVTQAQYDQMAADARKSAARRQMALVVASDPARFGLSMNKFFADGGEVAEQPSPEQTLQEIQNTAQQGQAYRDMQEYLKSRDAMPSVRFGYLPPGINGVFSADRLNIGTGSIKLNEELPSFPYRIPRAPAVLAHEVAHAADRQMMQQAIEQRGKGNKFTEAYEKMVGPEGKNRVALARQFHPQWTKANRSYRSTPYEIAAHGVGAFAGPNLQDDAPLHVDPTAATEFEILLDLARRHVNEGPKGISRVPAFFKKLVGYADGGDVGPTPEEIAAASRPATFNPNIARQGAAARDLASKRDVNTLPDPRTYAFVSGLLGQAPDELGFSVFHPKLESIKKAGEVGFAASLVPAVAPVFAPVARAVGRGATALGMRAEKALEAPVTRTLEGGGRSAEMLQALGAQPSFAVPPSQSIFQHIPTNEARFVGRLDEFVANLPGPVRKDQFLGQIKGKFREYDIIRAEETLADLPGNAKLSPTELLNRIKSKYDPSSFKTTTAFPNKPGDFHQDVDNPYASSTDPQVGMLGVIHLSQHVNPDMAAQTRAIYDLNKSFDKLSGKMTMFIDSDVEDINKALIGAAQGTTVPLPETTRNILVNFINKNNNLLSGALDIYKVEKNTRFPAGEPDFFSKMYKRAQELTGKPIPTDSALQKATAETMGQYFDEANQLLIKHGYEPFPKPNFEKMSRPATWMDEDRKTYDALVAKIKDIKNSYNTRMNALRPEADQVGNIVRKDLQLVTPYKDQHPSLRAPVDPIAFSRYSDHDAYVPGMGKLEGIYVHELQSDRLDDIRKLGKRGGSPQADQKTLDEIDAKFPGLYDKRYLAEARGDVEAVAKLNNEIDGLSYRRTRISKRIREGEYNIPESFANMENLPQVAQQLMAKNAVIGAIQDNRRFVAFPGKESAQSQLYEKLPRNLKDVVKDLGPGFELREITLTDPNGLEMMHNAIVWSPEAAARIKKKGVPFKSGGMVERQNTDNRAYL